MGYADSFALIGVVLLVAVLARIMRECWRV